MNALFDTGCTTNMMNSNTARKLGLKITPVGPTISRMANGDRLNISGKTIIDLRLGAHVYESVPFLIAPLPMHEVFLGLQFQCHIAPFKVDFNSDGTGHVVTSNGEKLPFGKPSGPIVQLEMKSGRKHPANPCSNQGKPCTPVMTGDQMTADHGQDVSKPQPLMSIDLKAPYPECRRRFISDGGKVKRLSPSRSQYTWPNSRPPSPIAYPSYPTFYSMRIDPT